MSLSTRPSTMARIARVSLAHLPTPLLRYAALDVLVGTQIWIKRDDATAGAEAGNKIRKLEYLLAEACAQGARVVVTCGGAQSNHARATAIAARRLGMRVILLLRAEPQPLPPFQGNLFLSALLGADIRFISVADYAQRDLRMAQVAAECARAGEHAYVIPEGGSNGLGALGYVEAMAEIRVQLDANAAELPTQFDAIVHACGSGGTAAGAAIGAGRHRVAHEVIAMAVCDDRAFFERRIDGIIKDATQLLGPGEPPVPVRVIDDYKGPAYGVASPEQLRFIAQVAQAAGLILDPVYTGKALYGLSQLPVKPASVLFVHTGGLPGLLAETDRFMGP
jgi:D-cysteine desulfhydrase